MNSNRLSKSVNKFDGLGELVRDEVCGRMRKVKLEGDPMPVGIYVRR
jgi:hypothetical protein